MMKRRPESADAGGKLILTREEKEEALHQAAFHWPGVTARGFRTVKSLIWILETTADGSRTAEIIAGKMLCSVSTYNEALKIARHLGVITVTQQPGVRSSYYIDWPKIQSYRPLRFPDPSGNRRPPVIGGVTPPEIGGVCEEIGGVCPEIGGVNARTRARDIHSFIHKSVSNVNAHVHEHVHEDVLSKAEKRTWWGRDQPLSKADLIEPSSKDRLFEYAVARGRFERHDVDRRRFWSLCTFCVRKGHIPGALLTRCVFGSATVNYAATDADEQKAAAQLLAYDRQRAPALPEATVVAQGMSLPSPTESRRMTQNEMIAALKQRSAAERREKPC